MNELTFRFDSGGARLHAVWHRTPQAGPVVLFHHGFTGNKEEKNRIFVTLARRLAEKKIESFRFDFLGSGGSDSDLEHVTLTKWMANSLDAVAYLRKNGVEKIILLGFSFGAFAAAATAAEMKPGPDGLILWAPIFNPLERMLREKEMLTDVQKTGYAHMDGQKIGPSLMEDAAHLQVPKRYPGKVLLVHGNNDDSALPSESERYKTLYGSSADLHWIEGANHTFDHPEWVNQVISITGSWIDALLAT